MGVSGNLGDINDGGGYDLDELKYARSNLDARAGEVKEEPKKLDPEYIVVNPNADVASTKEYGTREVFVDYDIHGNVVGVELL